MEDSFLQSIATPKAPAANLKKLYNEAFNAGAVLSNYISKKMKMRLPAMFKDNCDAMDVIREQLRNAADLSIDRCELIPDYIHLLTVLTSGFDLNDPSIGIVFKWGNFAFRSIQFEFYCLCYNLAVGIVQSCSKIVPSRDLQRLVASAKAAKSLVEKSREYYSPDFENVLPMETLNQLTLQVTAIYYQAQLYVLINANKFKILPQACVLAAKSFANCHPAATAHAQYYYAFSRVLQSIFFWKEKLVGKSIAEIREAIKIAKSSGNNELSSEIDNLKSLSETQRSKMERDNDKIYFDPVPKEVVDIPALSTAKAPVLGSIKWDVYITPAEPFQQALGGDYEVVIMERLKGFQEESKRAYKDIEKALSKVQAAAASEAAAVHAEAAATKAAVVGLVDKVQTQLQLKAGVVSVKCPAAFGQFNQIRGALDQATRADAFYEAQLKAALAGAEASERRGDQLREARARIEELVGLAGLAADDAKEAKERGVKATAEAMSAMSSAFDAYARDLNAVFADVVRLAHEIDAEPNGASSAHFRKDVETATTGFKQGLECYKRLHQNLVALLDVVEKL